MGVPEGTPEIMVVTALLILAGLFAIQVGIVALAVKIGTFELLAAVQAQNNARPAATKWPAGWYDDPNGNAGAQRFWDGHQWTQQTRTKQPQQ